MSAGFEVVRAALRAAGLDRLLGDDLDELARVVVREIVACLGAELLTSLSPAEAEAIGELLSAGDDDAAAGLLATATPDGVELATARVADVIAEAIAGVRGLPPP